MKMKEYTGSFKSVMFALIVLLGVNTPAFADLNSSLTGSGLWSAGSTSSHDLTMTINTTSVEYASLVTLTLPPGWSGVFTGGIGGGGCGSGTGVVCQDGGNVLIIGDPTCGPDDGCGPWDNGTYTITIALTAPAGAAGLGSINVDYEIAGDGFGCPTGPGCNSANGLYTVDSGSFALFQASCSITCPADIVVNNDPGECGAFVTIPDPVVDAACAGTPTNFLNIQGPNTPYIFDALGLIETPTTLSGVVNAAGNVTLTIDYLADHGATTETFALAGPDDVVFFTTSGGECLAQSFDVTIPATTWNGWISSFGTDLTFTLQPDADVDEFCATNSYSLAAAIPQSSSLFDNDYNFAGNASDFYPVGTTTVTYFTFDQSGSPIECTFNVTVVDAEGPSFVNCPSDITINLDPGACEAIVTYETAAIDNCPPEAGSVAGPYCDPCADPSGGSALACAPFAQNSIIQFFPVPGDGTIDFFTYNQETFGQEPLATVFIYAEQAPGVIPWVDGGFTPLGQQQFQTSNANNGQCVTVDFDTPVQIPAGAAGVWIEVFTPGTTLNSRIVQTPATCDGNTGTGQLTYINAPLCGLTPPLTFAAAGFNLDAGFAIGYNPGDIETVQTDNSGFTSGDAFPIGTTTQTWVATDLAGNTSVCEFSITIAEFPNPILSLTCNDDVEIALDGEDCMEVLNADLLLEGGPYGCYDDYIVEILGKGGNVLNGDDVGKSYTVKVTDPETGNFCTTDISVVDNIPPTLTGCIDVTVSCNDDITPNAPISGTLLVGEGVMGPVPETGTAGMASFDLNVSLPPVDILDVDIYMQVDHTWVSDLSASLTSPNGTSVTLFTTNTTCTSDNMDVTFDDEAANTHAQFEAQCNANPAKEGEFQPQQALSAFDGSANGQSGDWVLDFNDTTGGDSGNLNEVELRIEFAGSFPAPTAFDACGDVSLTFQDEETNFGACDDITKIITRTWTAVDESGNVSTCAQQISVTKASFADVGVPPNYDDQDQPSLACDDQANWDQDGDGLPDPAVTGGPTGTCDNINFTYEDVVIPICEGSFKVLRKWTLIDWCVANGGGDAVLEYNQIIKVSDKEGPSVVCPPDANVNANSNCQGAYILPDAQVNDNCSGTTTIAIFDEDGNEYAPGDVVMGLELGTYVFTYVATDDCGNESDGCTHIVTVEDNTPPVPICDEQTSVSLGSDGEATVCAETFDDGSYDNCEVLAYKVKRADDPSFVQFTDCVTFDCSDVGQTIMVRLRVYDIVGNNVFTENDPDARFNECTVEVTVDDQLDPVIVCPPNKIIDCGEFDPAIFDGVSPNGSIPVFLLPANEQIGFYSNAFDNCGVTQINVSQNGGPDQCGEGTVTRIYTAVDADGQTSSCVQIITITNSTPFNITDTNCFNANPNDGVKWPCDISLTTCGAGLDPDDLETNPGVNPADVRPIINEDVCDLVGVSFDDTPLPIQPPGCISLVRKWTVVDWCQPDNSFPLGYVTWTYNQEITVFESLPPTIAGCDDVTVFGFSDNCEPFATGDLLTVQGDDDCTPVDDLVYTYKIDAFFDPAEPGSPTYDFTSDFNPLANPGNADNSADGSYPIGTHLIQWAVEDGCGNLTTCQYTFTVVDATPPTPICKNLTVSLVPTGGTGSGAGTATVFAAGFENGDSYDNCTAYDDLVFSFEPFDYFNGTPVTERMYDCDDLGPALPVEIYVYDEYGNFDFCETFVLVKDPLGVCNVANQFDVTGAIETENNDPVAKVDVTLNNNTTGIPQMITTDNSGLFNFSVPANNNVQVEPAKDINYTNGVTTFDLVQITKHVLSLDLLDSPYKIIAADASNDGVVSTYDVVLLRKLILNIDQELEFNDSWRFVDASYVFPNQNNPFNPPFPEVVNINDIAQDELFNDFVGVKIGDVTGDAKANEFVSGDDRNFTGELVFAIDDAQVAAGEVYTVDFKAADFNNILGYQFTMNFDNNAFDLVNIEAGNLSGLTESNFGLTNVADGVITTSWNAENVRVADDEVLFSITFKAKQTAQLSNALSVNSSVTKAEAYTANLGFYTVALRFDTENGSTVAGGEFELYQNEPNPFKSTTVIGFNLPKAAAATLTIYDVSGKVVKSYEGDFAKGYNNIVVERSELGATGVLYYELSTDEFTATKKMITIE